jgi:hypothetical protein
VSILHQIVDDVNAELDFDKAKNILLTFLRAQDQSKDIKRMITQVQFQIFKRDKLISWMYNNILAFEGNRVMGGSYVKS